ncbi:FG-GAP-like repeat-containing protein [Hymenobacter puniceus]|uniref:FG-GAP-like repeat-containing protein n=1 Tax=Hymenobacter sp. BT190 TaxID=2763505 RepID=UPI001651681D|nr:FG-GAP-like repeat-containing protein [Hymenobacter sp. BT190]MBC6697742.1 VCBS repeat-containing protein [Hymenobacter sp. BT190]
MKQLLLVACRCGLLSAAWLLPAFSALAQVPIIASVAPASGAAGTSVTISGSGFAPVAAQNAVLFGAARATVTAASATQLTVQVPVGAASVAPIVVSNLNSQRLGSSLSSTTPFFTVRFAGPPLNASSYQTIRYPLGTSRLGGGTLATADFNADNFADFALTADGLLQLVLSDGQGNYQPRLTLPAGVFPTMVVAEDVDANGTPDLLVATQTEWQLLRNLGNGNGFASAVALNLGGALPLSNFAVGASPIQVQDVTGDGRPDLLVLAAPPGMGQFPFDRQLLLLAGTAVGFDPPAALLTARLEGLGVADFNQDGRLDIVLAEGASGGSGVPVRLQVLLRNAANTGFEAPEATLLPNGSNFLGLVVADANADSRADAVTLTTNPSGGTELRVAVRTATGFTLQSGLAAGAGPLASTSLQLVADADGDGLADLLTAQTGSFGVLRGQTGGSFAAPLLYAPVASNLVAGDFNNDGRTDISSYFFNSGELLIYRYTGASPNQNNPPTLNALPDLTLDEDAPQQTVALNGISNGGDAGQAVTLTAVSSDPSLVPNPTISYFSPTSTGTLRLQPAPNAFGTCTITVTASDGQAQNGTLTRTFRVTVNPVNDAPTLDPIPDIVTQQPVTVALSGITAGPANETEPVSISALVVLASGGSIGNGNISYTSPSRTGQFFFPISSTPPAPGLYATVTLTVNDGQASNSTFSRTFRIFYQPGGSQANAPTLDPIADATASRALATQVPVPLAGITDGDPNQVLPLTVTATSSDPSLVTPAMVSYTSPATTGSLPYTISSTRGGTATISVTVSNGQSQNGSITRSFRITVPQVLSTISGVAATTLDVYPNPTSGGGFWLKSPAAGPADVTVLDLSGRVVWQGRLASLQQPQRIPLAVAAGLYVVRVRTAAATLARRLVVE